MESYSNKSNYYSFWKPIINQPFCYIYNLGGELLAVLKITKLK